ncbi:MAG TPA: molybdopterin molybdotransferase MoeA [Methanolinea sp.]|nr:molybdopterin molybdotransferase MoeA [Methanolinea sp.]HQK55539.1 molybdopterin molybdotransferase MoeA [Methanolinea sp.]
MSIFLRTIPVEEAIHAATSIAPHPGREEIPLEDAAGRVLAEAITADVDIPGFNRSIVDGYAVRASDTIGAGETIPSMLTLLGTVRMGQAPVLSLKTGECAYIPTGGELPDGADAVVMIEHCERIDDQVLVKRPVAPGENLIRKGEDFARDMMVLPGGRRLTPPEIGVLAAVGCHTVPVCTRPSIGVISTGNELIPVREIPTGSQIRDSNSAMIGAYLQRSGCCATLYGVIPDDRQSLQRALERALSQNDAVILSGGSSKDDRDLCADIIGDLGEVLVHGVAIAPGKPTIIGKCRGKPVLGLPGHPASALVVLDRIGRPLLAAMAGEVMRPACTRSAQLAQNIPSVRGREDYVRVRLEGDRAYPLFGKSGLLNTLVQSDGLIRIPAGREGLEEGETIEVIMW